MASVPIPLSSRKYSGHFALIDEEDAALVAGYHWCISVRRDGRFYAMAYIPGSGHKGKSILMHRLLLDAPPGVLVDHVNTDGLDNRRQNIRFATGGQNNANRRPHEGCLSRFKGVNKAESHWTAAIQINRRRIYLGYFINEEDAARAYDAAAREHFGAYARLNFP